MSRHWFSAVVGVVALTAACAIWAPFTEAQSGSGWRIRQGTQDVYVGTVARPQSAGSADFGTDAVPWGNLYAQFLWATDAWITSGSGTGITVNRRGKVLEQVHKMTIIHTNCVAAAVTCDATIATLPAGMFLKHALIDLTDAYACVDTCTSSTLSATLGKTAGGNQYVLSFDLDAATGVFGDAAAELGASLAPGTTPTLNGDLGSWTTTTAITLRITSGTGNLGNGTTTRLASGEMAIYLTTILLP